MLNFLFKITKWYFDLYKKVFGAIFDLIHDFAFFVFSGILDAIAISVSLIPVPDFLVSGFNLGSLFVSFPPLALYIISKLHIPQAFAILGAGITFRLLRKVFTLGQW